MGVTVGAGAEPGVVADPRVGAEAGTRQVTKYESSEDEGVGRRDRSKGQH